MIPIIAFTFLVPTGVLSAPSPRANGLIDNAQATLKRGSVEKEVPWGWMQTHWLALPWEPLGVTIVVIPYEQLCCQSSIKAIWKIFQLSFLPWCIAPDPQCYIQLRILRLSACNSPSLKLETGFPDGLPTEILANRNPSNVRRDEATNDDINRKFFRVIRFWWAKDFKCFVHH